MAAIFRHILQTPPPPSSSFPRPASSSPSSTLLSRPSCIRAASSPMDIHNQASKIKFTDFPYVSAPHRNLMVDLVSTLETRLGSELLPCTLPPDVQYYQNETGTNHASLHIRSGLASSPLPALLQPSMFFFSRRAVVSSAAYITGVYQELQRRITSQMFANVKHKARRGNLLPAVGKSCDFLHD